ncbi:MAG TPA: AI-2E family transporter [Stellaceae bacterium]|nr:AI-2E family transporter [Stellaceae bacterium]
MAADGGDRHGVPAEGVPLDHQPGGLVRALIGAAIVVAGLYFAGPVLEPLALAGLLSLMLAPAVRWLQRRGLGRAPAVLLSVAFATAVILGLGAAVGDQAVTFMQRLPQYQSNLAAKIDSLNSAFPKGGMFARATRVFRDLGNDFASFAAPAAAPTGARNAAPAPVPVIVESSEPEALQIVRNVVGPLLMPIASAGLVLLFLVMILLKREDLRDRVLRLAGDRDLNRTTAAMDEAADRVSRYLLAQLGVGICYGVPVGVGLALIGIPNALLWAMLAVALRFLPYLGGWLTAVLPAALAIAVAPGWGLFLWTILLFTGIELVVANLIEPWIYGRSTGLSAVAVIIAAVFWTWLWGLVGLLLATPLTVCCVVLGRYVPQLQFLDILLGNRPVLSPSESLYQRLLARDPEEATEQAEETIRHGSLVTFFDNVAIPALLLAQADSDRGALSHRGRAMIVEGFAAMLDNLAEDEVAPNVDTVDGATIVCLAGRNELDLGAAWLLQRLLLLGGHRAAVFSPDAAATFNIERLPLKGVTVVCLSLLSTNSTARARYLVRRIRRQARRARVVVGFWGQADVDMSTEEAVAGTAADRVVRTLAAGVADIEAAVTASPGGPPPAHLARQSA